MWTPVTRTQHNRDILRYSSDLTDAEWEILPPLLPPPAKTGRHREWDMRELINEIFYVLRGGVPWRMLPDHFPPHQMTCCWFMRFRDDGTWKSINHHLVMQDRERPGRAASQSAAVIDTQNVKTTEAGGPRGYDATKKIKGRKRHAMIDTDGVPGNSGAGSLGAGPRWRTQGAEGFTSTLPLRRKGFTDSVYAGEKVANATSIIVESVWKLPDQVRFQVLPTRRVVERFFACINRNRRLAKAFEASIASATAFLYRACVMLLTRQRSFHVKFELDSKTRLHKKRAE